MAKSEYYTILTKIGIAKFIAARASGNGINLKSFKLSSKVILPSEEMQSLEEIVYEANISSKSVDESNPNYVNLMCHVPSDVGGFEVNAAGIYDEAGDLLAVGNVPRTYKPILKEGSAKELMIKIVMELSNAEEVILKLDPSVIMASRDYVDAIKVELNLKIDALTQKYDAEFKKVWDEFAKYLLENKFNTEIAKYVILATNQTITGAKDFTKLPTSSIKATNDNQFVNLATLKENQLNLKDPELLALIGFNTYLDGTSLLKSHSMSNNVIYTNTTGGKTPIAIKIQQIDNVVNQASISIYINNSLIKKINAIQYTNSTGKYIPLTHYEGILKPNDTYKIELFNIVMDKPNIEATILNVQ
ncbi:TPA_asm: phage tail protein [Campylobacter jejuni]|uniref:phage tail protein n=1 Tax=Campylobacter jejuni TaxID=197 RepID=UPI0012887906|nr:phage tail protein [Campylobacter jejuni]EAI3538937.1 phage tail protein [Campylobacter jejuni]EAJ8404682.1 phage tail protein [Campylobacter jejuni]EAM0094371.1 phage tail protein [Campylobacter jejuni]EAV9566232.1 phage tail protein [Campylobacter jejuni]ECK8350089.1 phage tail protein [Campylobacter jejuni]